MEGEQAYRLGFTLQHTAALKYTHTRMVKRQRLMPTYLRK